MVMNAVIQVRDAAFSYGGPLVFEHIDLDIYPGRICCLMGVNGCGKSTLIDCMLGVHPCSSGQVLIGGKSIAELKPAEIAKQISYVPQVHDRSFPYLVRDIVLMGRTAYQKGFSAPGQEDMEKCEDAMRRCGIAQLADRPYTQISGGEMQMVMLTRALVQDTPVIIMDEPTAHLDFRNEQIFLETVANLVNNQAIGAVIATHSPNQAFYFENAGADIDVALMAGASLRALGKPSEVLNEEVLQEVYGMKVRITDVDLGSDGRIRQLIPIRMLREDENRNHDE